MQLNKLPFNLFLLDNAKSRLVGALPVQSANIYFNNNNAFDPQGLYSSEIFGDVGSKQRQQKYSFIDMRTEIMHPKVFMELTRLKMLYKAIMQGTGYAVWDATLKDFVKSDIIDGETGYQFFMSHFNELFYQSNDSNIRALRIEFLDKVHDKCLYRYLLVIPAGLRDIELNEEGRVVEDEIAALYRKVIRASNTISIYSHDSSNRTLNTVRWNLQNTFNDIYGYIESILAGKKGFLLAKWAARNIHGGTRNVITAMDAAAHTLGAANAITINDTACGLHQYLKGTADISIFNIKSGPMFNICDHLPNRIMVVDSRTLRRKQIEPSLFTKDNWGTDQGIEKLINGFAKLDARHKPVMIDGDYAALIYRDQHHYRVFYDIGDLPSNLHPHLVKPITWGEMFYISVYQTAKRLAAYVTRYPITGIGSIYPSFVYLKTTVKVDNLIRLDDQWKPVTNEVPAINMPVYGQPFIESMAVHPSKVPGLGADKRFI